ncbi:ABC transporter permease [Falsiroseomonas oryzae]|uniref:ABC transporter permease n=1 Tax=Falsiroseomonas oryzae TaxID=2766473 RepID=UPI0022EAB6DA|nr:ABC transporter permease [Roseomonas sp. MO-31]
MRDTGLRGNALVGWIVVLFLILPLTVVIPVSFTPERFLSLPGATWSLRHYRAILDDPTWLEAFRDSLIVAIGATAMAVVLGTSAAVGCWRLSSRLSEFIRMLMLLPIIVPAVVHALGFYRAWVGFGLIDTHAGLIAAHGMKGLPYVLITVSASLADFDQRLEMAARSLGASPARALRSVVLPAARPGILAGAAFAFVTSWDELVVTLFITSRGVVTLPRRIWDGVQDNISPTVAAVATLLMLVTILATFALARKRTQS